jgi:cytidylate kinase
MDFQVVCISRTMAAGGETVGHVVAQDLGFRYVDEQIISKAAELAQVDPAVVAATEQRRPLLERLLDKLAMAYDLAGPATLAVGLPLDALAPNQAAYRANPDDLRVLIRAAIHEVARAGRAVIVAHAASMALSGVPGILRVLVTASPDVRAQRWATVQGCDTQAGTAAIAASDHARRDYFQRFYKIKEELPTHYDVVINTDVLTPDQVSHAIVAVARGGSLRT